MDSTKTVFLFFLKKHSIKSYHSVLPLPPPPHFKGGGGNQFSKNFEKGGGATKFLNFQRGEPKGGDPIFFKTSEGETGFYLKLIVATCGVIFCEDPLKIQICNT